MSPHPIRDERLIVDVMWLAALLVGLGLGFAAAEWSRPQATMHLLDQEGQLLIEFAEEPTPEQLDQWRAVFRKYEARELPSVLRSESNPWDVDPLTLPHSGE